MHTEIYRIRDNNMENLQSINGISLCVHTKGSRKSQPIIISHGWLDQIGSWIPIVDHLADNGFYVITYDQRGHGKSEHNPSSCHYHFPDYVADLQDLITKYALKDFILIGHSMGGTIASIYAGLHPTKPAQLILIDGLGPVHENEELALQRYQKHLQQRLSCKEHKVYHSVQQAAQKIRIVHPYINKQYSIELATRITRPTQGGYQWRWDPRHRDKAAIGFQAHRHRHILSRIKTTTTLIFGKTSWYLTIPDLQERIESFTIPTSIKHIESGHSPHIECPEEFSSLLLNIISSSNNNHI
jgi:pimeloyl-ACP methyl ester carboxylesterase